MVNKVTISDSGQVFRNKAKNINRRKKEKPNKKEMPVSVSHEMQDAGIYRGARVMKARNDEDQVSFNGGEYRSTDSPVNPTYDGRCHPHWKNK